MILAAVFKCGHVLENPLPDKAGRYHCPECSNEIRKIESFILECQYPGCGEVFIARASHRIYCDDHQYIARLESNQRGRKGLTKTSDTEGLSLADIAEESHVSIQAVGRRQKIAMDRFKKNWVKMHPDLPNPFGGEFEPMAIDYFGVGG